VGKGGAGRTIKLIGAFDMMARRGYSLVEMVVVIGIMSILTAIATPWFKGYLRRYRADAETRMIYSELLKARATAVYERRTVRVKLYQSRFEVYSSAADAGVVPIVQQVIGYPIVWNLNGNNVDFDNRGMTFNLGSICLDSGDGAGSVDSVVVDNIRVRLGKKDKGDDCKSDNITIR
jgi:prepilin-type N-terminal cleavage/methylation domain-containing protein